MAQQTSEPSLDGAAAERLSSTTLVCERRAGRFHLLSGWRTGCRAACVVTISSTPSRNAATPRASRAKAGQLLPVLGLVRRAVPHEILLRPREQPGQAARDVTSPTRTRRGLPSGLAPLILGLARDATRAAQVTARDCWASWEPVQQDEKPKIPADDQRFYG